MSQANSLNELFVEELQILLSGEEQLIEALPTLAGAANSDELREAFEHHLAETREHAQKLHGVLRQLGKPDQAKFCPAMEGIVKAGGSRSRMQGADIVRDAALIVAAQRVEHFEIAGYGSARTFATLLGHDDIADVLSEIEDQEIDADTALTAIAEKLNEQALVESS